MNYRLLKSTIFTKKHLIWGGGLFILTALFFLFSISTARADPIKNTVLEIIGVITQAIISLLGSIFLKIAHIIINRVAPYNDFIDSPTVTQGWSIVRDISNMFFIIILLAIAFGTMFGRQDYDYKQRLPRLLIMAIMINFSKTITGLVIDASQVGMLTFVNAFQAAAGGNLANALGIHQLMNISKQAINIGTSDTLIGMLFAILIMAISTATVGILLITLIYRIGMLWIITILSPAAFLLSTFRRGEKFYNDWWEKLICWSMSGPVLAFFLWLALATASSSGDSVSRLRQGGQELGAGPGAQLNLGQIPSEIAEEPNLVRFIIGILLLLAGIQVGQEFCARGTQFFSGLGRQALGFAKSGTKRLAGFGLRTGWRVGKGAVRGAVKAPGKILMATETGRAGVKGVLGAVGRVAPGFAAERLAGMQEAPSKAYEAALKTSARAAAAAPDQFLNMVKRSPGLPSPQNDAEYAARLKTGLTDVRVWNALKDRYGGDETKAGEQTAAWFSEYEAVSKRSGNKDVMDGLFEVKKKMPHMIKDDTELNRLVKAMGGAAALDMSPFALKDERVVAALSDKTKAHVEQYGSQQQKEFMEESESKLTAGLRPDLITDPKKRRTLLTNEKVDQLSPAVLTKVFGDLDSQQQKKNLSRIDASQLTPDVLKKDNGRLSGLLATARGGEQVLRTAATNKTLAPAINEGLLDYRQQLENKGAVPRGIDLQISLGRLLAGAKPSEAFNNYKYLAESMPHLNDETKKDVLTRISAKDIQDNAKLSEALIEGVSQDDLIRMSQSSKSERETAREIARQIKERVKGPIAGLVSDALAAKAEDISNHPILKKLI